MVTTLLNIILLKITLKTKIGVLGNIVKPILCSCIMIAGVLFSYIQILNHTNSNGIACIVSIALGAIIYMISIVAMKVFSAQEIMDRVYRK